MKEQLTLVQPLQQLNDILNVFTRTQEGVIKPFLRVFQDKNYQKLSCGAQGY